MLFLLLPFIGSKLPKGRTTFTSSLWPWHTAPGPSPQWYICLLNYIKLFPLNSRSNSFLSTYSFPLAGVILKSKNFFHLLIMSQVAIYAFLSITTKLLKKKNRIFLLPLSFSSALLHSFHSFFKKAAPWLFPIMSYVPNLSEWTYPWQSSNYVL